MGDSFAAAAAAVAGVTLLADAALGAVTDTTDHTTTAGATSEALFALALLGAAAVAIRLTRRHRHPVSRTVAWAAAAGLVASALTAVSVPLRGTEPSEEWTTLVVLLALVGLLVFGVIVAVTNADQRLAGIALAMFLPITFFGGSVGAVIAAAAWLASAWVLEDRSAAEAAVPGRS